MSSDTDLQPLGFIDRNLQSMIDCRFKYCVAHAAGHVGIRWTESLPLCTATHLRLTSSFLANESCSRALRARDIPCLVVDCSGSPLLAVLCGSEKSSVRCSLGAAATLHRAFRDEVSPASQIQIQRLKALGLLVEAGAQIDLACAHFKSLPSAALLHHHYCPLDELEPETWFRENWCTVVYSSSDFD